MGSELPLVCICIPTYNAAGTIRETLESILAQTYHNLDIHISDNVSTDETLKIIESIAASRVHIHRNEKNTGADGNFARCIQLAEGKYTAIFHADDIYEPDIASKQVAFLEANPEVGAVFTAATTIDEQGIPFGTIGGPAAGKQEVSVYKFSELIKAILEHSNFLVCPSAMVRTRIYQEEIIQWRGDLFGLSADLDVWLRIASKHPIAILNVPLMRHRISNKQLSNSVRLGTERPDIFLVFEHYLGQPDVQAFLSNADLRHYRWLNRNNQVWRAINLFSTGRVPEAKDMLRGVINLDAVHAALNSRRNLLTLIAATSLYLFIAAGAWKLGKVIVHSLRTTGRK